MENLDRKGLYACLRQKAIARAPCLLLCCVWPKRQFSWGSCARDTAVLRLFPTIFLANTKRLLHFFLSRPGSWGQKCNCGRELEFLRLWLSATLPPLCANPIPATIVTPWVASSQSFPESHTWAALCEGQVAFCIRHISAFGFSAFLRSCQIKA